MCSRWDSRQVYSVSCHVTDVNVTFVAAGAPEQGGPPTPGQPPPPPAGRWARRRTAETGRSGPAGGATPTCRHGEGAQSARHRTGEQGHEPGLVRPSVRPSVGVCV